MAKTPRIIPTLTEEEAATFWAGFDRTTSERGCWLWLGELNNHGYGMVRLQKKQYLAHRVAFVLTKGAPPSAKPLICHDCDNPRCGNPVHLWPGNFHLNAMDASSKGRMNNGDKQWQRKYPERRVRGEQHGQARLTDALVVEVCHRFNAGERVNQIARSLKITAGTLLGVIKGEGWIHVAKPPITGTLSKALKGEENSHATITENDVRLIRWLIAGWIRSPDIATKLGISKRVVDHIKAGETWRHVV